MTLYIFVTVGYFIDLYVNLVYFFQLSDIVLVGSMRGNETPSG